MGTASATVTAVGADRGTTWTRASGAPASAIIPSHPVRLARVPLHPVPVTKRRFRSGDAWRQARREKDQRNVRDASDVASFVSGERGREIFNISRGFLQRDKFGIQNYAKAQMSL